MYEIIPEYSNSRRINYNRWSTAKEVGDLVAELGTLVTSRKNKDYLINMKVVVVDLYQAYLVDPTQYVAYFRGEEHYRFFSKYNANKNITYDYLVGSINLLAANGYIKNKPGGFFNTEEHGEYGFIARMRATDKLAALFGKYKLTPDMIGWFEYDSGLVVLKDFPREEEVFVKTKPGGYFKTIKVKDPIDYDVTKRTNYPAVKMIKQLVAYNKLLDMTYIDIDVDCISEEDKKELVKKQKRKKDKDHITHIDLSSKRIHRVFNNRSWVLGGRFYNGWWISTPGVLRKYIYINGEPTVELDFKGMHIHFLYAMKGINYAPLLDDPYSLVKDDPNRDLNKLLLLTAFNAESEDDAIYSTSKKVSEDDLIKFGLNKRTKCNTLRKILAKLKEKHIPVADLIADEGANNIGLKLQYLDSRVAEKVIDYFTKKKIPVLSVHDSIICAAKHAAAIKDRMLKFYAEIVNSSLEVSLRHFSYDAIEDKILTKNPYESDEIKTSKLIEATANYSPVVGTVDYKTINFIDRELVIKIKTDNNNLSCSKECSFSKRYEKYLLDKKIVFNKRIDLGSILFLVV